MRAALLYSALLLVLTFGTLGVSSEARAATYFTVLAANASELIVTDGNSAYKIGYSWDCYSSDFSVGETILIDSLVYPSWGDTIVVQGLIGTKACEVTSSEKLNLRPYYVVDVLDSNDNVILQDKYGNQYLVEYGIGCLSMWRYKNKTIYVDIGGSFLDGIGDQIYLFDSGDDCRIWDAEEINTYSGSYIPPLTTTTYTPPTQQSSPQTLSISDSPYQNVNDKKIYRDLRARYDLNPDLGCNGLSLTGEDLEMCYAYSIDDKNKWTTIERPTTNKTQSQLAVQDPISLCQQKLGPNGIVAGQNLCGCASGYVLNTQQNYCVIAPPKKEPVPTAPKITDNSQLQASVAAAQSELSEELNELEPSSTTSTTLEVTTTPQEQEPRSGENVPLPQKQSLVQKVLSWFLSFFR